MTTVTRVIILLAVIFGPTIAAGLLRINPAWGLVVTGAVIVVRMWKGRR